METAAKSHQVKNTEQIQSPTLDQIETHFEIFLSKLDIEGYEKTKEIENVLNWIFTGLIQNKSQKRNFILRGPTGTGKTVLMKIILQFLAASKIIENPVFLPVYELTEQFRRYPESERENYLYKLKNTKYLILDDAGTEETLNVYGTKRDLIQEILYSRYDNYFSRNCRTYFTTNLTLKQLGEKYGQRVLSRIVETYEWDETAITGSDRRITGKTAIIDHSKFSPFKLRDNLSI